ncbi:hypothetical protein TWF281_011308 [Arthrobotrys megalospora]
MAMANRTKSYFLAPVFDWAPDTLKLGSIVKAKEAPHKYRTEPLTPECHRTVNSYNDSITDNAGLGGGIFGEFLKYIFGVGGSAAALASKTEKLEVVCEKLETKYFEPSPEYLRHALTEALKDGVTSDYMISRLFGSRRKMFMITGIKTVEGVKISTVVKKDVELQAGLGLDGTLAAAPLSLGPQFEVRKEGVRKTTITATGPLIIAYRVTEIVRKIRGNVALKDVSHGALFSGRFDAENPAEDFELRLQDFDDGFIDSDMEVQPPARQDALSCGPDSGPSANAPGVEDT